MIKKVGSWVKMDRKRGVEMVSNNSQGVWGQHLWKLYKEDYLSFPELRKLDEMYIFCLLLYVVY